MTNHKTILPRKTPEPGMAHFALGIKSDTGSRCECTCTATQVHATRVLHVALHGGEIESKKHLITRMKMLADEMRDVGAAINYFGGFAPWAEHGLEMINASRMVDEWVDGLDGEL